MVTLMGGRISPYSSDSSGKGRVGCAVPVAADGESLPSNKLLWCVTVYTDGAGGFDFILELRRNSF